MRDCQIKMADNENGMSSTAGDNSEGATSNNESNSTIGTVDTAAERALDVATKKDQVVAKPKIDLLLKATGDAPIMKQRKWAVEADRQIGSITLFMKKYLKMEPQESLFLYINQAFAPSPDQILRNLYECFGTDGKLVLHYCKTQAWG